MSDSFFFEEEGMSISKNTYKLVFDFIMNILVGNTNSHLF